MRLVRFGEALIVRAGALAAGLALAMAAPAGATTIEVETDADEFGAGGSSACTLREAVEAARKDDSFGGCPAGDGADKVDLAARRNPHDPGDTGGRTRAGTSITTRMTS